MGLYSHRIFNRLNINPNRGFYMETLSFEESLTKLEGIVQRLERGDLPLEEGLKAFEEGISLSKQCQSKLDSGEKRIEELTAPLTNTTSEPV
jgi:exodeoxyribonuclease VII small subunit